MSEKSTREHILSVTRDLLKGQSQGAEKSDVTIAQVAAAAHISRATLYRYFANKAALFSAAGVKSGAALNSPTGRERILEAMLETVAERGMHGATLEEIAARADLSLSGLHWHFRNKDELIAALMQRLPLITSLAEEAAQAEKDEADVQAQLARIGAVLLEQGERYSGIVRLLLYEAMVYPDVAQIASAHSIGRFLPLLTQLFERHAVHGRLRPGSAQARAQAFFGMFVLLILLRPAFDGLLAPDDEQIAAEYIDILLHGILPSSQAPQGLP